MQQLIAHLFGDYILQNDWMALNKAKRTFPCLVHVVLYTIPFILVTHHFWALAAIMGSHFLIDRFGLARYLVYAKNKLLSLGNYPPWSMCDKTGYFDAQTPQHNEHAILQWKAVGHEVRPLWLTVWLTIVADNTLHLLFNWAALKWL